MADKNRTYTIGRTFPIPGRPRKATESLNNAVAHIGCTRNPNYADGGSRPSADCTMEVEVQAIPIPSKTKSSKRSKAKAEPIPTATCGQLFRFATPLDGVLMVVGALAALFTGAALPLFITLFADLLEEVGGAATGAKLDFDIMYQQCIYMLYLGAGAQVCGWIYGWAFDLAKERQLVQLKKEYLKAIVRQDVGWYDVSNPQELPGLVGSTQSNIASALGTSTWQMWEFVGLGIAGFSVSLSFGWDIALVMIGVSPIAIFSGVLLGYVEKVSTSKISKAYAVSGGIASESLSAIRTVASFGLEPIVAARYESHLHVAEGAAVKKSYLKGLADALLFGSGNAMMAVGMLYDRYRTLT
jgi:ATP-binding cassette subfamily B (MDR/TAP) protein 1